MPTLVPSTRFGCKAVPEGFGEMGYSFVHCFGINSFIEFKKP